MRKILFLIILGLSLMLIGCGNDNNSNKNQSTSSNSVESVKTNNNSKTPKQLSGETLGGVQPGMDPKDVDKILGEPVDKKTLGNGRYCQYYKNGIRVDFTTENNDVLQVWKITSIYNPSIKEPAKTSKGINVDSSISKIFDTYGQDGYVGGEDNGLNYLEYETTDKKFIIRFAIRKGDRLTNSASFEYISLRGNDGTVSSKISKNNKKKTMINGVELGMTTREVVDAIGAYTHQFTLSPTDKNNSYGKTIIAFVYENYDAVVVFEPNSNGTFVIDVVPISKF